MCAPACRTAASVLRVAPASAAPLLSSPASAPTQAADLRTGGLPHSAVSSWRPLRYPGATHMVLSVSVPGFKETPWELCLCQTPRHYLPVALTLC